jgi:hypothetical protein
MNIQKIIGELREERLCLDEALIGLEKLARKRIPRRGRPPAWMKLATAATPKNGDGLRGSTRGTARRHLAKSKSA